MKSTQDTDLLFRDERTSYPKTIEEFSERYYNNPECRRQIDAVAKQINDEIIVILERNANKIQEAIENPIKLRKKFKSIRKLVDQYKKTILVSDSMSEARQEVLSQINYFLALFERPPQDWVCLNHVKDAPGINKVIKHCKKKNHYKDHFFENKGDLYCSPQMRNILDDDLKNRDQPNALPEIHVDKVLALQYKILPQGEQLGLDDIKEVLKRNKLLIDDERVAYMRFPTKKDASETYIVPFKELAERQELEPPKKIFHAEVVGKELELSKYVQRSKFIECIAEKVETSAAEIDEQLDEDCTFFRFLHARFEPNIAKQGKVASEIHFSTANKPNKVMVLSVTQAMVMDDSYQEVAEHEDDKDKGDKAGKKHKNTNDIKLVRKLFYTVAKYKNTGSKAER
jgi:hypothetical protein